MGTKRPTLEGGIPSPEYICWKTELMRCWDTRHGGNMVNDGNKEWTLVRHFQGKFENFFSGQPLRDIKWMHLPSEDMDLVYFNWGHIKTIEKIYSETQEWPELLGI